MPCSRADRNHAVLRGFAGLVHFGKARGEHHVRLHAALRQVAHRLLGMFGCDRNDGDIGRFRQVGDRGIRLQTLHLGAVRVHRIQRALEALRLHVGDRAGR